MSAMVGGRKDVDIEGNFKVYDLGEITTRDMWVTCLFVGP
jgi:hypothetical protein